MTADRDEELDEFSVPLGRGMRRVDDAERTTFRRDEADALQDRLDEFDAVLTRGEFDSRSARLGGRTVN